MKILMTADRVGGVWTYAQELRNALPADVFIAPMGPGTPYRLEWEDDPWKDVERAGAWLLEIEEELQPDLIHLNAYAHASLPWRAPVVVAAHSDVVSWWWAVHGCDPPPQYDPYRSALVAGLRAADAVVAPTAAVLADLERHHALPDGGRVIHNGSSFAPGRAAKEPVVAAVGRFWDAAKNLAALEAAREECPWPIVAAGPGTALGPYSRDRVRDLLARASVYAAPALYEPFGLGPLEAARSGCALVLADIASFREVWADAALFVGPHELAAALQRLAHDGNLLAELAERARRRASAYTVERMAFEYSALYDEVLARVPA